MTDGDSDCEWIESLTRPNLKNVENQRILKEKRDVDLCRGLLKSLNLSNMLADR